MPRLLRLAALLAMLAFLAACGGGDDDDDQASTAAQSAAAADSTASGDAAATSAAASGDAATVLAAAKAPTSGPVHTTLTLKALFEGEPTDPTLGAFLTGPIELAIDGTADAASGQADVSVEAKAGALNINGKLLSDGTSSWVGLGDTFYALPAGTSAAGTTSAVGVGLGSPADYLQDPEVVGTEDVEGVEATHIRGTLDVAKLTEALNAASEAVGGSGLGGALAPEGDTAADAAMLQDAIEESKADVWVAKATGDVVRVALDLDVAIPEEQQAATAGITGAKVQLDVTTVPGDPLQVTAPPNPRPADELQNALLGSLLGGLGGASGDGLGGALG